jgi:hypothetical protein
MKLVPLSTVPAQPWRNGGGTTQELLAWPTPGHWLLRVSVARIGRDGPFSAYPGITRHFVVLAGAGVELSWQDRVVHLSPRSEPLAFDGAEPPGCRLIDGATDDLNLMTQAGAGRSRLQRAEPGRAWHAPSQPHARWRGLYTHEAALLECDGSEWPLAAGTLAWDDDPHGSAWTLHAAHPGHAFWLWLEGAPA